MFEIARRPAMAWRSIGLIVLLAGITLAMLAALIAGSRPRVPAPFGTARTGLVAYANTGDIYVVDPTTGVATAAVTGPETDRDPRWSRDGTRVAFLRNARGGTWQQSPCGRPECPTYAKLYVANADGTDLRLVTPEPFAIMGNYMFSPDGSQILLTVGDKGTKIVVVNSDGSGSRVLDVGTLAVAVGDSGPSWRPPDGAEIAFVDGEISLHAVNPETGVVRTIVGPSAGRYRGTARWSPDGSRLSYIEWVASDDLTARTHIINADGTGDRVLPIPPGAVWQAGLTWSNDGTQLFAIRGYSGGFDDAIPVAVPIDGGGFGVEIDYPGEIQAACCSSWEWAPDDTSILGTPTDLEGQPLAQVLLDPAMGTSTTVPWKTTSHPTWQRLAP